MAVDRRGTTPVPLAWHVPRWNSAPFSGGTWTTLGPGGTPAHRARLGEPVDGRFVVCGDATHPTAPSMVHGAVAEGRRGAQWALSQQARRVLVIGAGAAGLAAASELAAAGVAVVVLEARHRVGGRVHTVDLGVRGDGTAVRADAGAAWLQQWPTNDVARFVERVGLPTSPTDFAAVLAASPRGEVSATLAASVDARLRALVDLARASDSSASMDDAWQRHLGSLDDADHLMARRAIEVDLGLEHGLALRDWGVRAADEDGVGVGDRWLPDGYATVLGRLAPLTGGDGDCSLRTGRAVRVVSWGDDGVQVVHEPVDERGVAVGGPSVEHADVCLCTVPVWLLDTIDLRPGLPVEHRACRSVLRTARVEKVLLRFDERWWPASPGVVMRWYDEPAGWGEWFDLTDGLGAPVVAGFCAGEAVTRLVDGHSDDEVVTGAVEALRRFTESMR